MLSGEENIQDDPTDVKPKPSFKQTKNTFCLCLSLCPCVCVWVCVYKHIDKYMKRYMQQANKKDYV